MIVNYLLRSSVSLTQLFMTNHLFWCMQLEYQRELKAAYRDIQSSYKDYHASLDKLYKRRY